MDYWDELENLPEDQYRRRFRHFTPAQLRDSMRSRGLDVDCTDPGTLAALARIDVAYLREREAEQAAVAS